MGRSLRVAVKYIQQVKSALPRNGYPSQKAFATEIGLSLSTVKNFLSGKPVDYINFVEISEKLGLEWQEIADKEPEAQENNNHIGQDSPFVTGSPITHPRHFFGRQKELKRLFNLLKRHPLQNAAIIGQRRIGKTSLLHYLKNITATPIEELRPQQKYDWLTNPEIYRWVFVDFQDPRMSSKERFLSHILETLRMNIPEPCDLDNFMDVMSDNLHNPTVILLDEIGVGLQRYPELDDEFWESLRSLATNHTGGNLAFILATHESPIELAHHTRHSSPFFNIFGYTATLRPLKEEEARELIASSPIPFTDDNVEWIIGQSQGIPLLLQILCRECLFHLEDGDTDDWREEGLRQIEPFNHLLLR
ncbi:ATP-binding protein [Mastigocoleus sp. MO_188.B34]|uniref:TniB family NTP-binding protein n=1 Tax=Mastigocoleus sp. MO_188.B34 TaxID=3036635 RepID=UPI00262D5E2A|nr:ATP-binding protein [Mastigocoleus sp. MO_188.B34]MDJ0692972.1 TniB family NTP-binding protein [Mastigocoleus sp. MO_188.B34]